MARIHAVAAFALVVLVFMNCLSGARPKDDVDVPTWVQTLRDQDLIKHGKAVIPIDKWCDPNAKYYVVNLCGVMRDYARMIHQMESTTFCAHEMCGSMGAEYDPSIGLCQCGWGYLDNQSESHLWPDKHCDKNITCQYPLEPHWNPSAGSCTCALQASYPLKPVPFRFEPNALKNAYYGPSKDKAKAPTVKEYIQAARRNLKSIATEIDKQLLDRRQSLKDLKVHQEKLWEQTSFKHMTALSMKDQLANTTGTVSLAHLPTHIPPPHANITDEFVQESLSTQPQHTARVASVIPNFAEGTLTFLVQLDGPVPQTLSLNASDTLPCGSIGTQPQSVLVLAPKNVKNGTAQAAVSDCLIVAADLYIPNFINYWIQKEDGSVHSGISATKIHAVNRLDASQPAGMAIGIVSSHNILKRDITSNVDVKTLERRQIFQAQCSGGCPFYHMELVQGSDGYCGCMFKDPNDPINIKGARGVESPFPHKATMVKAACTAMTCPDNGGKPALFNAFSLTCWCVSPNLVAMNETSSASGM